MFTTKTIDPKPLRCWSRFAAVLLGGACLVSACGLPALVGAPRVEATLLGSFKSAHCSNDGSVPVASLHTGWFASHSDRSLFGGANTTPLYRCAVAQKRGASAHALPVRVVSTFVADSSWNVYPVTVLSFSLDPTGTGGATSQGGGVTTCRSDCRPADFAAGALRPELCAEAASNCAVTCKSLGGHDAGEKPATVFECRTKGSWHHTYDGTQDYLHTNGAAWTSADMMQIR